MTPNTNRSIRLLAVAGTSLGLLLTGCANPPASSVGISPSAPSDVAVHWMDGFCGSVHDLRTDNNAIVLPPASTSPTEARLITSKLLGGYEANLGKAIDRLAALPPISDPVGKAAYKTFLGKYTSAHLTVVAAKARLDGASPSDNAAQQAAAQAMDAAQENVLSVVDPVAAISSSPELSAAAGLAPRCTSVS
jgi:hypothetical protein